MPYIANKQSASNVPDAEMLFTLYDDKLSNEKLFGYIKHKYTSLAIPRNLNVPTEKALALKQKLQKKLAQKKEKL